MEDRRSLRNYLLLVMDGAFGQGCITLLDPASVLTLFISAMTGSTALAGLVITVMFLSPVVGKLLLGPLATRVKNLVFYTAALKLLRVVLVGSMAIPLFLDMMPAISTRMFFMLFSATYILEGALDVPLGELKSRVLTRRMRGHMSGISLAVGGGLSVVAGLAIHYLLNSGLSVNRQYAAIFSLAAGCVLMSFVFSCFIREYEPAPQLPRRSFSGFYQSFPRIIKEDATLRAFFPAFIAEGFSHIIVNYTIGYSVDTPLFSDGIEPRLNMFRIVGILIGGLLWGEVSRRRGNRAVMIGTHATCAFLAFSLMLSPYFPWSKDAYISGLCLLCGIVAPGWIGRINYLLDIAPENRRINYQVLISIVSIPLGLIGLLASFVVVRFGYIALFAGCGIAGITTSLLSLRLKSPDQLQ